MVETLNEPSTAIQNPDTLNPSINDAANINNAALITNINKPSVTIVTGRVRITKIGFTTRFNAPSINAAIIATYQPVTSIPLTKCAVTSSANAVTKIRDIIFILV